MSQQIKIADFLSVLTKFFCIRIKAAIFKEIDCFFRRMSTKSSYMPKTIRWYSKSMVARKSILTIEWVNVHKIKACGLGKKEKKGKRERNGFDF